MENTEIIAGMTQGALFSVEESIKRNSGQIFKWITKHGKNLLPLNFNVAVAIGCEKGSQSEKYKKQIVAELIRLIQRNEEFLKKIKLEDISSYKMFNSVDEAKKFRKQKNLDLIIWGNFSIDGLRNEEGKVSNKLYLNFTFGHPDNKKGQLSKIVLMDITSRFYIYNNWNITEETSLKDIEIISSNTIDISIYIVALTYKLWGRLSEAIQLFEELYKKFTSSNPALALQMIPHLINCYEQFALFFLYKKKDLIKACEILQRILFFDQKQFFALTNLARWNFELGKIDESWKITQKLLELYPGDPCVELDVAFHKILQSDLKLAFKHYQRLILTEKEKLNFNPVDVVQFLDRQYQNSKNPAFLYAGGLIAHYYDDKVAKQILTQFLLESSELFSKEMYRDAKKIIKQIN